MSGIGARGKLAMVGADALLLKLGGGDANGAADVEEIGCERELLPNALSCDCESAFDRRHSVPLSDAEARPGELGSVR